MSAMPEALVEYLAAQPGRCPNGFDIKTQHPRYCKCRATLPVAPGRAKADALARTNAGANDGAKARIDAAILAVARRGGVFSANDVRDALPAELAEGGLMGARFNALASSEKWEHVGYVPSTKANTNGHPIHTWRAKRSAA